MSSKQSHEGYMVIDHSASPGIPDAVAVASGLPPGAGHGVFETATFTCSHCQAVVVKHPFRERARGYCRKCDHYICDVCETKRLLDGVCYPFKAFAADMLEAADKAAQANMAIPFINVDKQNTLYPDLAQAPIPVMVAEQPPQEPLAPPAPPPAIIIP
jgi:hypothetical protein